MQISNPFPGMNPYLENHWPGVHTRLIAYVCDAIGEQLPSDLSSRAEEEIAIEFPIPAHNYRSDIAVLESRSMRSDLTSKQIGSDIAVSEPVVIEGRFVHRWVEVREANGRLITIIEILSPSNKRGPGWIAYMAKQASYLASGVNLVEIDLLRTGDRTLQDELMAKLKKSESTMYLIVTARSFAPNRREIYYCPLMERLPAFRVPLRPADRDAVLDLQPLINRCYETGRYWQNISETLLSPALPSTELHWSKRLLLEAGLRGPD